MRRLRAVVLLGVAVVLAMAMSGSAAAPPPTVSNVIVTPVPNLASHLARYTITFTTSATGALVPGNTITLRFPSGTVPGSSCGNVASFANNVTVNGVTTSVSSIVTCLDVRVTVPVAIGSNANVTVVVGSVSNVVRNPGKGTYAMKVNTTSDFGLVGSARYTIVAQAKPVAGPVAAQSTPEDVAKTITLTGSDADGDPLTFLISSIPAHGSLSAITPLTPTSASVTYTPVGNYNGPDSFRFRVNDGIVTSSTPGALVSITVNAVNDAPVAVDDDTTVAQDSGPNAIAVLGNDSDADGDTLTITSNTAAANGTAACGATSCTYTPNGGFFGDDSFTYTIGDGNGGSDTATVHVEVTPTGGGGGPGTASFELCAKTGSVTMPDAVVVDTWGFALGDCDVAGAATLPGPMLDVDVGDEVSITLDNSLAGNVSLEFPGQNIAPDPTGTPTGTEKTYTFVAGNPGTYLYESGMNRQVLMGLYGALIVRPTTAGQAYDTAASAFDVEVPLVLSEIDPAFNADPDNFSLLEVAPKYWLINGAAFPDTGMIAATAGDRVLLRYLNAGSIHHTMTLLGLSQRVIGRDANPVRYPYDVQGETIPAGSTLDTIVTIPVVGPKPTYPLYNRQFHLDNAGVAPGGMMILLDPQPAAARAVSFTLGVGSLAASARGDRVRIAASTVACSPCKARARVRVRGEWRSLLMSRSNGRWVASFPGVPSGRWAYEVRVRDLDSGIGLVSARQTVQVS